MHAFLVLLTFLIGFAAPVYAADDVASSQRGAARRHQHKRGWSEHLFIMVALW